MQQEGFLVGPLQRVDPLLILAGPERGDDQRLGLAAGEQRRAVGARQHADFRHDRTDGFQVTAVDALAGVEDIPAHDLGFDVLEHAGDAQLVEVGIFRAAREVMLHDLGFDGGNGVLALDLAGNGIRRPQLLLDQAEDFLFQRRVIGHVVVARVLGGLLGQLDDRPDHRLEVAVSEHHGAKHDVFVQLPGFRLDHQHGVGGAGDDQVEVAFGHFVERGIENVFIVGEADAGRADRAHERRA